jgi:uncharacterized protein (TIGR00255 family)
MLKSMTGFGRGEYSDTSCRFVVEIKSVNHRYNEISIRMPKKLSSIEDKIRRTIGANLHRGRIDVFITTDEFSEKEKVVRVDKELALAYHKAVRELGEVLNIAIEKENVYQIAKYQDIFKIEDTNEDALSLWPKIEEAILLAANNLTKMRLAEGENINRDFICRLDKIGEYINSIFEKAPLALSEHREKLLNRMRDVLANIGAEPDETRLLTEAAIYADRTNFTEELIRLKSHLEQFRASLSSKEAIGRKLDFIVQEINRETNTIASKANDFTISNITIEIKSEIEKIREQIQNIE